MGNNQGNITQGIDQTHEDKGLINPEGQNNCFLNVIVQSLYHLKSFRLRLIALQFTHTHSPHVKCLLCALATIFNEFHSSRETEIPPNILRATLASLYEDEHRFQIGEQEDAHEALTAILNWLHADHVGMATLEDDAENVVCQPRCIAHECFGSQICTMRHCRKCNATSEPETEDQFIFTLYAHDLASCDNIYASFRANANFSCPQMLNRSDNVQQDSVIYVPAEACDPSNFDDGYKILKDGKRHKMTENSLYITTVFINGGIPDFGQWRKDLDTEFNLIYDYVEKGGKLVIPQRRTKLDVGNNLVIEHALCSKLPLAFQKQLQAQLDHLMNPCSGPAVETKYGFTTPHILTVNIVWHSFLNIEKKFLKAVHTKIPEHLSLPKIVRIESKIEKYRIRAVAGFYGRHYVAFCYSSRLKCWCRYDDEKVERIGETWEDVVEYCTKSNWRMTVLFYETLAAQPRLDLNFIEQITPQHVRNETRKPQAELTENDNDMELPPFPEDDDDDNNIEIDTMNTTTYCNNNHNNNNTNSTMNPVTTNLSTSTTTTIPSSSTTAATHEHGGRHGVSGPSTVNLPSRNIRSSRSEHIAASRSPQTEYSTTTNRLNRAGTEISIPVKQPRSYANQYSMKSGLNQSSMSYHDSYRNISLNSANAVTPPFPQVPSLGYTENNGNGGGVQQPLLTKSTPPVTVSSSYEPLLSTTTTTASTKTTTTTAARSSPTTMTTENTAVSSHRKRTKYDHLHHHHHHHHHHQSGNNRFNSNAPSSALHRTVPNPIRSNKRARPKSAASAAPRMQSSPSRPVTVKSMTQQARNINSLPEDTRTLPSSYSSSRTASSSGLRNSGAYNQSVRNYVSKPSPLLSRPSLTPAEKEIIRRNQLLVQKSESLLHRGNYSHDASTQRNARNDRSQYS